MPKVTKPKLILLVVCAAFLGLTYDIDYCRFTADSRGCYRIWGIRVPWTTTYHDGYRSWLQTDIGLLFPQEYVDYLNWHPLIFPSSTPPGNWLDLRNLKKIYDSDAASHDDISKLLKKVASRHPPVFMTEDLDAQNELADRYLSHRNPAVTSPRSKS
jgi:hypothetical protein